MKKTLPLLSRAFFVWLIFTIYASAQTTVFNDEFTTSAGTSFTTATGPIGTSPVWNLSRSGTDYGGRINGGNLTLTNDAGGSANNNGWGLASANTANFTSPYSSTLASNPGTVTWSFNMRQINTNPGGFSASTYGSAFILAGTSGTTNVAGTGYAVILGNSGNQDPVRLVRYSSGIRTYTTLLSSTTSGLTDFGNHYLSIRVSYTPGTNTWQLFVRKDGTSAFLDPSAGTLTSQGTAVNNTYTGTSLSLMGAFWNASTGPVQTAFFDNVKVTVVVPVLASLLPSSKIAGTGAFTLTVNGANFVNGTSGVRWNGGSRTTTFVSSSQLTAAITAADIASSGTASVTVANGAAVSNALTFTIDVAGEPSVTVSPSSLAALNTVTGTASSALTYTVSGSNLTADVGVSAPANFEVSTNGTTFFNTLTLTRTGNVLVGQPVTVYVRLKASATAGSYSGTVNHTTTGGVTKQVSVSGTVLAVQPTAQAASVSFTNITSTSFTVNWTPGNGANRIVLVRSGSAVNAAPADGTSYTPQTAFATGDETGTDNYAVYTGSGSSVTVTALSPATTYHVAVYEYNGSGGTENYFTTSPATGNRTTLNAPVGWQIYSTNTVNTITFDSTVDGVNQDDFQADGLAPVADTGSLNSNAWAIAGFSDGNIAFGGTSAEGGDFDRGVSGGGVADGGVYAFETSAGNSSLGIQPATADFAPGTVTLRFQNQTGAAVTSLNLAYKVYVYNDQASSSNFNFSYSPDNATYTAVAGLNVVSPAAADASPEWKAYSRVVTLTGLNIANNNYYYLRWSGATVSGSVDFDEFALDDITAVANPSTVFAPLGGQAESVVLQGNATLSADVLVSGNITFNGGKLDLKTWTLALNGTVTNTVAGGIKGGASSNLTVGGSISPSLSFDQTTPGTTNLLNNLSVATTLGNTVTVSNAVAINGQLSVAAGQTLDLGTTALTGTLSSINNNGTILTQNTSALPLPSGKSWNGTGLVHYNAAATAQTVVAGTYSGLRSSSTAGATAGGALTVNGTLDLPSPNPDAYTGSLDTGSYELTMGGNAVNTGVGDMTGVVTRNSITADISYTFGHANTSIFFPNIGTVPTSMSLMINIGTAPAWRPGAINRMYNFIQTGGSDTKALLKVHYLDSELNGNDESKLVNWVYIVPADETVERGRSNFSMTENFVELTNLNIMEFASTFGELLSTLDESEASVLMWNGSTNTSWTMAGNWTPVSTPSDSTSVTIPDAATTANDPFITPTVLLGSLNIEAGGILNATEYPIDYQFTINNGAGAWINNGTYNPGISHVIFTNADATIAGETNFNDVTINAGAGLYPVTNNIMRISGELVNNGDLYTGSFENTVEYNGVNQVIAIPNGAAYHNLIISGTGAVFPASLNITGNLTLNQPVDFTGTTITMSGNGIQSIGGSAAPAFNNLTVNKASGQVNLLTPASVNGTLTLTSGNLSIGSQNLTLGQNPVAGSFSSSSMIVTDGSGEVRHTLTATGSYTFPIGEVTTVAEYSPITVFVNQGTFSNAYVGVSVSDAVHPNNSSADNSLSRYWKVSQSGITGALATVTANYTNADIRGTEANISAAQLNGTFNQQTNPWVKYTSLSGNTLTAASAPLTAGQVSYFTGIEGGSFTAEISGYGSFCENEVVTLTATPVGGTAPYTYSWSNGLGTDAIATPPTTTPGTLSYTVTVRDSNGITATDSADVTVLIPSVGGDVTPNQAICSGSIPGDLTLSGYVGDILHWQSSTDAGFLSPVNISNTSAVLTGTEIGPLSATMYYRAVVQNGTCDETYSSAATVLVKSSTWDGAAWSDGVPDNTTTAVIAGNFTATSDLTACTLTVTNAALVVIPGGFDVTLTGALTVSSGSFTLENNANLIQVDDVANAGNITVKRHSSALMRQDYTLWSSPVAGQNLLAFSPQTLTNRFYTYNAATNLYNTVASPASTAFNTGQGYLIRMPNNHPITPTVWSGQFTGVPNNGDTAFALSNGGAGLRFNAIGNPYPSPIDMETFATDNSANITATLYFWRKTNNATSPSYCSWTSGGGFVGNGEDQVFDPNGIIRTGQGFIVEASASGSSVTFNNAQRVGNNANQFFRSAAEIERNRIWLNATNVAGAFSQTLVGYITGATLGADQNIDGKYFNDGATELYSLIADDRYVIQGRPLPFTDTDVVPLGFKAGAAGAYTIAIDHVDGLFLGDQDIFLRDNLANTVQDLKAGAYEFVSEAGTFNSRFEVIYQNALAVHDPALDPYGVIVYKDRSEFVVNSGTAAMESIRVFDVSGRLLAEIKGIDAPEARFAVPEANQVLLFKIRLAEGQEVNKKVVN